MQSKNVLLIATDFYGYHSKQGTALSRRVKQVADSFIENGWTVTVLQRDNTGETGDADFKQFETGKTRRIVVKAKKAEFSKFDISFIRRLNTFYLLLFKGDRSYKWANEVIKQQPKFAVNKPELIISFFTPRVSILLGNYFQRLYNVPWIADLQDELDYGTNSTGRQITYIWAAKMLKTATAITTVSPEWAHRDGKEINRELSVIRHAVPDIGRPPHMGRIKDEFVVFYGGSLKPAQSVDVITRVLNNVNSRQVKLIIAGNPNVHALFKSQLSSTVNVEYKGWLNEDEYLKCIYSADLLAVIPWSSPGRQVIPSKFYELVATGKPLWVVGTDTGSFKSLFDDWKHPTIVFDDIDFQTRALQKAINGDFSDLFNVSNCKGEILTEHNLCSSFSQLL